MIHLFTATNANYFDFAAALLASFRHFHNGRMFVFAVGLDHQQRSSLCRFGAELVGDHACEIMPTAETIVCSRLLQLRTVIRSIPKETILLLDADSVFRACCDGLSDRLGEYDVGLRLRSGDDPNRRVFGGYFAVRGGTGADRFLEAYAVALSQRGMVWYADQWAIYQAYLATFDSSAIGFGKLPKRWLDRRLKTKARIWSPSARWRRSPKFLLEISHWRHIFERA